MDTKSAPTGGASPRVSFDPTEAKRAEARTIIDFTADKARRTTGLMNTGDKPRHGPFPLRQSVGEPR